MEATNQVPPEIELFVRKYIEEYLERESKRNFRKGSLIVAVAAIVVAVSGSLFGFALKNMTENAIAKVKEELRTDMQSVTARVETVESLIPPANGQIIQPIENARVNRTFPYEVRIDNPKPERYYYLCNRIGGQYWPKVRIQIPFAGGIASGMSDEGGNPPNGVFEVVVMEVSVAEHTRIRNWLEGRDFSGMQVDGTEVDSVKVILNP